MTDVRVTFPEPCDAPWASMSRTGENRFCDRCSTTVVDLEKHTATEVEALLQSPHKVCVHAKLGYNNELKLRDGPSAKRLIAMVGAGIGLVSSSPALFAKTAKPEGSIVGTVNDYDGATAVTAKAPDGTVIKARVRRDGKFKFKDLPPGIYEVAFTSDCGLDPITEKVVVEDGRQTSTATSDSFACEIIVGVIERIGNDG